MRSVTVNLSLATATPVGVASPVRVRVADAAGEPRGIVIPSDGGGRTR